MLFFWAFQPLWAKKNFLNFFHLENFLNSDIFGHMLIIVGQFGSFKGDWSKALFIFDGFPLNKTIKKAQCRRALSQFVNNTAYKKRLLGQLRPVSQSRQVCCLLS